MSFNYQKYIASSSVLLREEIELRGARLEFQSWLHLGILLHLRGNGVVPRTALGSTQDTAVAASQILSNTLGGGVSPLVSCAESLSIRQGEPCWAAVSSL